MMLGLVVRVLADGVADGVDHLLARVRALGVDLLPAFISTSSSSSSPTGLPLPRLLGTASV